jgi:hypothetical protein
MGYSNDLRVRVVQMVGVLFVIGDSTAIRFSKALAGDWQLRGHIQAGPESIAAEA